MINTNWKNTTKDILIGFSAMYGFWVLACAGFLLHGATVGQVLHMALFCFAISTPVSFICIVIGKRLGMIED